MSIRERLAAVGDGLSGRLGEFGLSEFVVEFGFEFVALFDGFAAFVAEVVAFGFCLADLGFQRLDFSL